MLPDDDVVPVVDEEPTDPVEPDANTPDDAPVEPAPEDDWELALDDVTPAERTPADGPLADVPEPAEPEVAAEADEEASASVDTPPLENVDALRGSSGGPSRQAITATAHTKKHPAATRRR
jgi:hypothetical protein